MRTGFMLLGLAVSFAIGGAALAADAPRRIGPAQSPISTSVSVPPGGRLVYVSGTVPDVVDAAAPEGSVARFGDTEAQTRSVLRRSRRRWSIRGSGLATW